MSWQVVGDESGSDFVPVMWLIGAQNAAELDSVSQANKNETLVLYPAVDGTFGHESQWIWGNHVFFFTGKVK